VCDDKLAESAGRTLGVLNFAICDEFDILYVGRFHECGEIRIDRCEGAMGFLKGLFGGGHEMLTAREAYRLAEEHLTPQNWPYARSALLCCVYASVMDTERDVSMDGKAAGWHFDFYSREANAAFLIRVAKGKAKGWEKQAKRGLSLPDIEYVFACYGAFPQDLTIAPQELPKDWADSPAICQSASAHVSREMAGNDLLETYAPQCILLPATYFSYVQRDQIGRLLKDPAPSQPCALCLVSPEDVESDDSFAVYVDIVSGAFVQAERFRFPSLFEYGYSADW
jgi:hypothetical protein